MSTVLATLGRNRCKEILVDKTGRLILEQKPRIRVMNYKTVNIFPIVK